MIFRLEMVTVPVADVDQAKKFYAGRLGFRTQQDVQLNVDDAEAAPSYLLSRGVDVTEIQTFPWGRFCCLRDPEGNRWSIHEAPSA